MQLINISSLTPGEYVAFFEQIDEEYYISVASLDGAYVGPLAEASGGYGVALSADHSLLLDLPFVIDLKTGNAVRYDDLVNCSDPSWSPDNDHFAASCPTNAGQDDIYIFSVTNHSKIQVTNCEREAFSCGGPSWSPDGKWIVYRRALGGAGTSKYVGMHIINTNCFSAPSTCSRDEPGLHVDDPYIWSPKSDLLAGPLAGPLENTILMYRIENGQPSLSQTYQLPVRANEIFWLPNGRSIAVSANSGRYLLTLETGNLSFWEIPEYLIFLFSVP